MLTHRQLMTITIKYNDLVESIGASLQYIGSHHSPAMGADLSR